jgi:hypothetical protein
MRGARTWVSGPAGAKEVSAAPRPATATRGSVFYDLPAGRWRVEVPSEHWSAAPVATYEKGSDHATSLD